MNELLLVLSSVWIVGVCFTAFLITLGDLTFMRDQVIPTKIVLIQAVFIIFFWWVVLYIVFARKR